jgi:uncharacterized protein (DUF2384 family)
MLLVYGLLAGVVVGLVTRTVQRRRMHKLTRLRVDEESMRLLKRVRQQEAQREGRLYH